MRSLLLFLSLAVIVFVVRFLMRMGHRASQGGIIGKIRKNPLLASGYADHLDMPYGRKECSAGGFEHIRAKMSSADRLGNYRILYAVNAGDHRILIFTELSFIGVNFTPTGKLGDTRQKTCHDFALQFYPDKNEVQLFSNVPANATDKFQKAEFLKQLDS